MRLEILYAIQDKYRNNIIKDMPELIIRFLHKEPSYLEFFKSETIKVYDILYYLRNKQYNDRKELLEWILVYVELKHGLFERAKQRAISCSNNQK